jgi:thymidylate synthase ThyX
VKITQVALRPTEASDNAGRPALTPELLAASGARYSRSNDGLDAILSKIDPNNLDRSVDSIFRMIDYGHQSIADMAPVAIFIDGISLWLAYHVWTLVPTAGGQESSTRYIRLSADAMTPASELGLPESLSGEWQQMMERTFGAYQESLAIWEGIAGADPDVARIPASLLEDTSTKAQKAVARMRRNYAFDRARYYLPVAAQTNMMLIMSARAWVSLCQHLLSHPLPEAQRLGEGVRQELQLAAPRMLKHATGKDSHRKGICQEFEAIRQWASANPPAYLQEDAPAFDSPARAHLELMMPERITGEHFARDLAFHDNRYSWVGQHLQRAGVRFRWDAVSLGEIRDLNRHRTGSKFCPLLPQGFYSALDQIPADQPNVDDYRERLERLSRLGREASIRGHERLCAGDPSYLYWTLLGTQYPFEHTTTADKFIYEAELRTGTGAHYRYAQHLHDALLLWYEKFPETKELILEGSAEPE